MVAVENCVYTVASRLPQYVYISLVPRPIARGEEGSGRVAIYELSRWNAIIFAARFAKST